MSARGKQVKLQNLSSEREIFLYDRRILASSSPSKAGALLPQESSLAFFRPGSTPDNTADEDTFRGWQALFKRRRAWAIELTEGSGNTAEGVGRLDREAEVVRRGTEIAVENIKQHVGNLRSKYQESKTWADQICDDQAFILRNWQHALGMLGSIGANEELGRCMQGIQVALQKPYTTITKTSQTTLRDLVAVEEVEAAARSGEKISQRFTDRLEDLGATFDEVANNASNIIDTFRHGMNMSDSDTGDQADRLMEEIEVLTRKINADYEHVLGLPNTTKSVSQASKMAHLHKSNFLPSLIQANEEINQLLTRASELKKEAIRGSIKYIQEISVIESTVSAVHSKLAKLDVDDKSGPVFDVLNFTIRLPSVYGSLLVECVRRQEWAQKMTADSSSLVEEVATYKEDEAKRRKRWIKDMDGAINLESLDDMALGIEVNVHSQKQKWPNVSRDDISDFLRSLGDFGDLDGALKHVEEMVKTLDAPSKQQARRAKAFKNGSVHEAAYGRTSLLLRGDDEVLLGMRSEKSRVEDKLKSAESRVRKLEDLLHRQSQSGPFSGPASAAGPAPFSGPTFERYATSPAPNFSSALSKARESGSRRASISSRRFSMNNDPDEKGLAQRIVGLEADLTKEKARSADLTKKAEAKSNAEDLLRSQVREAISTKEDLLGNLEAQQREFDDERHLLHEEKAMLTLKIDELEDEFDRVLGSRENEDRSRALEEELERVRIEAANELERAHCEAKRLHDGHVVQRSQIQELEREVRQVKEERSTLYQKADQMSLQLGNQNQLQTDHHRSLRKTLLHLSQEDVPEDFAALVEKVESIAERSVAHLNDIKAALAAVHADNDALNTRIESQDKEVSGLRDRLAGEEREVLLLREELITLQRGGVDLQAQLESERNEHAQLKTKFASGESNLDTLRSQLAEKNGTIADLSSKIAQHKNDSRNVSSRLLEQGATLEAIQRENKTLVSAQGVQASRSTGISERLISHNGTFERLLEQIGLTITRDDDTMVVQKASRATSTSIMLADPSASMKRSVAGYMPTKIDLEPSVDPKVLRWAEVKDAEEMERRFDAFVRETEKFDVDIFSEGVYKRVKEIEHIARKWQKEARAYRDKSHRAQSEAHDRIALRNFKEGDLALFLPTRDQATKPWAAFNVGAPHCFLREQDSHNLGKRDWLIARISKVEERVVDLSRSINGGLKGSGDQRSGGDKSDTGVFPNDENPYELSDGLRWYLIDAAEEKPGAPINVGTGKFTVASTNVDAKGSMRTKKTTDGNAATKTLTRSLDSRRSSTNSKKGLVPASSNTTTGPADLEGMVERSIDNAAAAAAATPSLQGDMNGREALETNRPQSSQTQDGPGSSGLGPEHVGNISASDS
jgi:autophagy-related protein 11